MPFHVTHWAADYFSPSIFNSNVYGSSVQEGTDPNYAVDVDFLESTPTCFSTDAQHPDIEGFHWLLIDFGVDIANIREIRIAVSSGSYSANGE